MMKIRCFLGALSVAGCVAANAETYRTNTVEGLIYILTNCSETAVIELEAGDYQMPDEPTYATAPGTTSFGRASIHLSGQTVRGLGNTPAAVRLVGSKKHRVVHGEHGSVLENLTITNGWTDNSDKTKYGYSNRCAGYYGSGVLTNCIITGNSARSEGGGINGGARLYDCVVENNEARAGTGGGAYNITAYRTIFRNNKASDNGGGVVAASLYDCTVSNNVANGIGGGAYNLNYATNTTFAGNKALSGGGAASSEDWLARGCFIDGCVVSNNVTTGSRSDDETTMYHGSGGGLYCQAARNSTIVSNRGTVGGGSYRCLLINCTNRNNTAWSNVSIKVDPADQIVCYQSGGGDYNSKLFGCTIVGNRASGNGGGVCADDPSAIVSNCVVVANVCSNAVAQVFGGGVCIENGTVADCEVQGNASVRIGQNHALGGGIASRTGLGRGNVRNCVISDNFAQRWGGGAYSVRLDGCVLSNNVSVGYGANAYECHLSGGEVVGTPVAYGSATGVKFHGFVPNVTLSGNPYSSQVLAVNYVYQLYPNCTNCLFYGNQLPNGYVFSGESASQRSASLVNCTIVSNVCSYMFCNFSTPAFPLIVENGIFYGNYHSNGTTVRDLSTYMCNSGSLRLSYCAYGVSVLKVDGVADTAAWFDGGAYQFGVTEGIADTPGFALGKNPDHPYSLKRSSTLLGLARVAGWMDDAYDLRGNADGGKYRRLRDDRADLGCYQCWYDPLGTRLVVR